MAKKSSKEGETMSMLPDFDNRPSFYAIIREGDYDAKLSLRIPPHFVQTQLPKPVPPKGILKSPNGDRWSITAVCKKNGSIFIEHGWPEFYHHHFLGRNEFLIFKYNGGMFFDVQIFNQTAVERHKDAIPRRQHHSSTTPPPPPSEERKENLESEHELGSKKGKGKSAKAKKPAASSCSSSTNEEKKRLIEMLERKKVSILRKKHHNLTTTTTPSNKGKRAMEIDEEAGSKKAKRKATKAKKPAAFPCSSTDEEEEGNYIEIIEMLERKKVSILPQKRHNLSTPSNKGKQTMRIDGEAAGSKKAKRKPTKAKKPAALSCSSSDEEEGNCIEIVEMSERKKTKASCSMPLRPSRKIAKLCKAAQDFTSEFPHFKHCMNKSSAGRPFMVHVPVAFRKFVPEKETVFSFTNSNGKSWDVRMIYTERNKFFTKGWIRFTRGNKLKIGDCCVFELLEPRKFKVHVFPSSLQD